MAIAEEYSDQNIGKVLAQYSQALAPQYQQAYKGLNQKLAGNKYSRYGSAAGYGAGQIENERLGQVASLGSSLMQEGLNKGYQERTQIAPQYTGMYNGKQTQAAQQQSYAQGLANKQFDLSKSGQEFNQGLSEFGTIGSLLGSGQLSANDLSNYKTGNIGSLLSRVRPTQDVNAYKSLSDLATEGGYGSLEEMQLAMSSPDIYKQLIADMKDNGTGSESTSARKRKSSEIDFERGSFNPFTRKSLF